MEVISVKRSNSCQHLAVTCLTFIFLAVSSSANTTVSIQPSSMVMTNISATSTPSIGSSCVCLHTAVNRTLNTSQSMAVAMPSCACPSQMVTASLTPSLSPSPSSAMRTTTIMSSIATPTTPRALLYYGYFPNFTSTQGVLVSDLFKYVGLKLNEAVAVRNVSSGQHDNLTVFRNGSWQLMPDAIRNVLKSDERVRLQAGENFTGKSNIVFSIVPNTQNSFYNLSGSERPSYTLIALTPLPIPKITFSLSVFNQTIKEDARLCSSFSIQSVLAIAKPNYEANYETLKGKSVQGLLANESQANLNMYLTLVARLMHYSTTITVISVDASFGKWKYTTNTGTTRDLSRDSALEPQSELCLKPYPNKYGVATAMLKAGVKDPNNEYVDNEVSELTINVIIINENDRPVILGRAFSFPDAIPYNKSHVTMDGSTVKNILSSTAVTDTDNNMEDIGIALVRGMASHIGKFQYKCDNQSWVDVNITNSKPLGKSGFINAIFLPPSAKLKFVMEGNPYWTRIEGNKYSSMKFLAWDRSNGGACGNVTVNVTEANWAKYLSSLTSAARLTRLRKGCDQRPGTVAVFDECDVCGGDNSTCTGCDNVINSGAKKDKCLDCYGGTTNKTENSRLDCALTCNKSYTDTCEKPVCQVYGFRSPRDCNGDCYGKAQKNKCNACVLGKTGLPANHWIDVCGKCNGTNSTCLDCAGVPKGKNQTDLCGKCKLPTDSSFNKGCGTKLGKISPKIAYVGGVEISVDASDLLNKNITCTFNKVNAASAKIVQNKIRVRTPSHLGAGSYNITCEVTGGTTNSSTATQVLTLIDFGAISVTGISPNITLARGSANLTISGTGFINTEELKCIYGEDELQTVFVNSTEIICKLPQSKTRWPKSNKVVLSFAEFNRSKKAFKLMHYVGLTVPSVESAAFTRQLNQIVLRFNRGGRLISGATCADIFPHNHTKFGNQATCQFTAKLLKIFLLGEPSIRLGKLFVDSSKIQSYAETTVYSGSGMQSVDLVAPPGLKAPTIQLTGPTVIGSCDAINLKVRVLGGNPGRLTYTWSVDWASGQTAGNSSLLNSLKGKLNGESGFKVKLTSADSLFLGERLTFKATVTTFLGYNASSTITLVRENKQLPQVQLSRTEITSKVSKDIKIRAISQVSSCLDTLSFAARLSYQWELLPAVGVELASTIYPQLIIPAQQLTGGKTYTATVVVSMQQDESLAVQQSATITTVSSKLVANIRGVQTISLSDTLTLSAAGSRDPDGDQQPVTYIWEILNMDNSAVVDANSKRVVFHGSSIEISLRAQGNLTGGNVYKFTMTYRVGDVRPPVTDVHYVTVLECSDCTPPRVVFRTTDIVFNPSDKLLLSANILGDMNGTYVWSSVSVEDDDAGGNIYGTVDLNDVVITKVSGDFNGNTNVDLKFKENVLSGNIYYRFVLTATNYGKISASAKYELKTNGVPSKGLFIVAPTSGEALNTTFTMSATSGWSDPDGDELQFEFWYSINGQYSMLRAAAADDSFSVELPTGNLTLTVRCIDEFGGFSEESRPVIVSAPTGEIDVSRMAASFDTLVGEQNLGRLVAFAGIFVSTISSGGGSITEAAQELQLSMTSMMCDDQSSVQTQNEKDQLIDGLAQTTTGGSSNFDPAATTKILNFLRFLFNIPSDSPSGNDRRRRSVSQNAEVVLKTPVEVETSLTIYSNLIAPKVYDTKTMNSKKELLQALDSLTASMCKGFAVGENAGIANNPLVTVLTVNKGFGDVNTARITLGAPNAFPASSIVLGESVQSGCRLSDGQSTCASSCVSSWEMKYDFLSSSANSLLLSSIIRIKLWDPEDQKELTEPQTMTSGMLVDIVGNPSNNTYVCHTWDKDSSKWVQDHVATVKDEVVFDDDRNTARVVTCKLLKMRYVALFAGPLRVDPSTTPAHTNISQSIATTPAHTNISQSIATTTTTSAPTNISQSIAPSNGSAASGLSTQIQPSASHVMSSTMAVVPVQDITTTTPSPQNIPYIIKFSFDYPIENCTRKLNESAEGFTNTIRDLVAEAADMERNSLTDFNVSCASIDVAFKLIEGNITVADGLERLRRKVKGGMVIVIDGVPVSAKTDSFAAQKDPKYIKPEVKDVEDDDLGAGAIVGIVIGVIAFVIIVIVVIYVCCVKKNSRKQATVEPGEPSAMELKGRSNQAYTDYP